MNIASSDMQTAADDASNIAAITPYYGSPISNQLTPPDVAPIGTLPLIPPAVASKGLEDYINWAQYNNLPNKGVWPKGNPGRGEMGKFKDKLDELFGVKGKWEDDGKYTSGRKQVRWVLPNGIEIIGERHPYDKKNGAPSTHTKAHYHVNINGQHGPGFKGTD